MLECTENEYVTKNGSLEEFLAFMIYPDLIKMTLNIYQTEMIKENTQGFKIQLKIIMKFSIPVTMHKGIVQR